MAADDVKLVPMTLTSLYVPILTRLESTDEAGAKAIRQQLELLERKQPGFLLEFTKGLIARSELDVNLHEAFLRLQAQIPPEDLAVTGAGDPAFVELSQRAAALRRILARIPDEMGDRRAFLETIKEIASSIKKLLDATNNLFSHIPATAHPQLESRKRDFVRYSKRFSNTLKDYFRGEDANSVYVSANHLIYQTVQIVKTVRDRTSR